MNITYYLAGLLSGISIASFYIGKELYKFYITNKVQKKQLERMDKLNKQIKNAADLQVN
jgi:hypothetical protein